MSDSKELAEGKIVTTLFQQGVEKDLKPLIVNGKSLEKFPADGTFSGKKRTTVIDGLGNGYYVWPGCPFRIQRHSQEWTYMFKRYLKDPNDNPCIDIRDRKFREQPFEENEKYYTPTKGDFNLAYFEMGETPEITSCVYTLLPAVSEEELKKFDEAMKGKKAPVQLLSKSSDLVFEKILLDDRDKQGRLVAWPVRSSELGRSRMTGHLLDRPEVQAEALSGFAQGDIFDEEGVADIGPKLHVVEHRVGIIANLRIVRY